MKIADEETGSLTLVIGVPAERLPGAKVKQGSYTSRGQE
jgi:hypothetical protein